MNQHLLTTASVAASSQPLPPSGDTKTNTAKGATAAFGGLDLLFAASQSQVEMTKPKAKAKAKGGKAKADGAGVPFPSSIAVVSKGGNTEGESGSSSDAEEFSSSEYDAEEPAADTISVKKNFPQVLQEILSAPELHPIVHWLPDGLSFIITNKQQFSDEILPKYFREALFHSFVRKLHRWGFRRVKSRGKGKGDGSSFAHNNFVRDKPWLCLNMRCKSKPSYHKVPSAKKKKADNQHHANPETADSLANAAHIVVHPKSPPSLLAAACGRSAFVPSCLPSTSTLPSATAAAAAAAGSHTLATIANTIQERQILMLRMRQRHQLQVELLLQRLNQMSSENEEQFLSSYVQRSMMAQYTHDMLHRNIFY
jgi:hypothetical protein